jgi:predicted nucleic acid-binding protein
LGRVASAPKFFLDTYAIIEYLRGNPRFARYVEGRDWVTSLLNLMETYYAVLRDNSEDDAERVWLVFRDRAVGLADEDVKAGMKTRLALRARGLDLSYADAVGYHLAQRVHAKFVTGDAAFSRLPHVEFLE